MINVLSPKPEQKEQEELMEEGAGEQKQKEDEEEEVDEEKDLLPNTSPTTCPLLKEGSCPHGGSGRREVDGKACEYWHPKNCIPWVKRGEEGCKKGLGCKKLHRPLCKEAVASKVCRDSNCRRVHLRGTNREDKMKVGTEVKKGKRDQRQKSEPVQDSRKIKEQGPKKNEKRPFLKGGDAGKGKGKSSGEPRKNPEWIPLKKKANDTSKDKGFLAIQSLLKELQKGMESVKKDQVEMQKTIRSLSDGRSWGRNRAVSGHHGCCGQVYC